jgi:hypothetical protein
MFRAQNLKICPYITGKRISTLEMTQKRHYQETGDKKNIFNISTEGKISKSVPLKTEKFLGTLCTAQ